MKYAFLFILFLSGLLAVASKSMAQGNLIIIPRRVVFEGAKRTQELNLANTGTDTSKYLISVIQYRMLENGAFESITQPDSGQYFADKNFRFFPRSVTLAPNEAQTVKIQTINTADLKPGEYRSHLYFRAVPNDKPPGGKNPDSSTKTISVHLVPIFGIAIPVIIRNGITTTKVTLIAADLQISTTGIPQLKMTFGRLGNVSVYGDIKVNHISAQGKATKVGLAKGFAIYTPNAGRQFILNLDKDAIADYHKGKLHIIFISPSDSKAEIIAEKELILF
ncbi:MAG TPA: hypothetical protein VK541_07305 [Pedobacter sp.]|uniref:fimbrial biogenesis chaperone n=1 Tax=Pedobacter sp. TaxID=1411316 RepID=UPI002C291448|nr:hypothetical protein [Pedobacter sp.]HMI02271.1 hypothetical protein [Pedobacter sp.]